MVALWPTKRKILQTNPSVKNWYSFWSLPQLEFQTISLLTSGTEFLKVFETFFIKKYCYSNNTLCGKISFSDGNLKQEVCRIRISNPSSLMLDLMKVSFVKMIDIGIMTWWQELQSKCKFQWFLTTRNNYK